MHFLLYLIKKSFALFLPMNTPKCTNVKIQGEQLWQLWEKYGRMQEN
jgi:hypothetical protein